MERISPREKNEAIRAIYPNGMHAAIAQSFDDRFEVRFATLDEPEHGLSEEVLASTDVLIWWGHTAHKEVQGNNLQLKVARNWRKGTGMDRISWTSDRRGDWRVFRNSS